MGGDRVEDGGEDDQFFHLRERKGGRREWREG